MRRAGPLVLAVVVATLASACATTSGHERADVQAVRAEILDLHRFFEDWFTGRLPPTVEARARVDGVLASEFELVAPSGALLDRAEVGPFVASLHAAHAGEGFSIRIENVRVRVVAADLLLATYEEWQETDASVPRGRLSSALFRKRPGTPHGVEWVHVHETWLAEPPAGS